MTYYFNKSHAAAKLAEALPERNAEQWALWLQNNRNPSRRSPYRIPFEKMGVMVIYKIDEIAKFIEWEKQRHLGTIKLSGGAMEAITAYGIGIAGGGSTGRKFELNSLTLQNDETLEVMYISLILNNPLMVFRIEIEEAKSFSNELIELIAAAERIQSGRPKK